MKKTPLKDLLARIDIPKTVALATAMMAAGHTKTEAIDQVVDIVDAVTPFDALGPAGAAWDAVDGPVVKALLHVILAIRVPAKVTSGS